MKDKVLEALEELELRYKVKESVYDKGLINTIKQALQSNVSKEDIEKILYDKDLEPLQKVMFLKHKLGYKVDNEKKMVLSQPQPTLEELKQSIIDRLNEYYKEVFVFDSNKSFRSHSYAVRFYSGTIWFQAFIPLDLAHDITKFFMEVKR